MFTRFNKNYTTLFLDPDSPKVEVDEKVNVILSPSLYWVKKLSLPLQSASAAKKLLPSIFEDTIPEGNYSYSVYKQGDDFFAFAYDDKYIIEVLQEKGIGISDLESVHFAQSELSFIQGALKINDSQSLCLKDGIVILLPCCWVEEEGDLDLGKLHLSKHTITLAQFGHIVDTKSLYKIGAILLAFIFLVATELFITSTKVQEITSLKEKLFTKASLQETMFQNEATLKKYEKIDARQSKIREYVATILSLKLKPLEYLEKITLKDKILTADFTTLSQKSKEEIKKKLKAKGVSFDAKDKKETWHLEMRL